jgi:hypothetical protein
LDIRQMRPINGKKRTRRLMILPEIGPVDGRLRPAHKFREMAEGMAADRGGRDQLTRGEEALIRRAAGLEVLADLIEEKLVRGEDVSVVDYGNVVSRQTRVLQVLGLERKARNVTLDGYIKDAGE